MSPLLAILASSVASEGARRVALRQLIRYVLIGLATNALGYIAYLTVTYLGTGPKTAASCLYVLAAGIGFVANRTLTFSSDAGILSSAGRYVIAHCIGYGINLAMLWMFVDGMGWPHQGVQLAAVFVVAGVLFLMMKFFVFRPRS